MEKQYQIIIKIGFLIGCLSVMCMLLQDIKLFLIYIAVFVLIMFLCIEKKKA